MGTRNNFLSPLIAILLTSFVSSPIAKEQFFYFCQSDPLIRSLLQSLPLTSATTTNIFLKINMLRIHVSMMQVHAACPCCTSMLDVHAACPCWFMRHVQAACLTCMMMLHVHSWMASLARPCCMSMWHAHTYRLRKPSLNYEKSANAPIFVSPFI